MAVADFLRRTGALSIRRLDMFGLWVGAGSMVLGTCSGTFEGAILGVTDASRKLPATIVSHESIGEKGQIRTNAFAHEIAVDGLVCTCQQRWKDQFLAGTKLVATEPCQIPK